MSTRRTVVLVDAALEARDFDVLEQVDLLVVEVAALVDEAADLLGLLDGVRRHLGDPCTLGRARTSLGLVDEHGGDVVHVDEVEVQPAEGREGDPRKAQFEVAHFYA